MIDFGLGVLLGAFIVFGWGERRRRKERRERRQRMTLRVLDRGPGWTDAALCEPPKRLIPTDPRWAYFNQETCDDR